MSAARQPRKDRKRGGARARCLLWLLGLACRPLALACKDLRHPEHLLEDANHWRDRYLLVQVERTLDSVPVHGLGRPQPTPSFDPLGLSRHVGTSFEATILQSFGAVDLSGRRIRIEILVNEEAHAVCPIRISPNQRFLVLGDSRGDVLTLSRYDQRNLPAQHPMFDTYLKDLQELQRNARPPEPASGKR